jgi:hypothetical protein
MSAFFFRGGVSDLAGTEPVSDEYSAASGSLIAMDEVLDNEVIAPAVDTRRPSVFGNLMATPQVARTSFFGNVASSTAAMLGGTAFGPETGAGLGHAYESPRSLEQALRGAPNVIGGVPRSSGESFQEGESTNLRSLFAAADPEDGSEDERCGLCYTGDGPDLSICGGTIKSTTGNKICVTSAGFCVVRSHKEKFPGLKARQLLLLDNRRKDSARGYWLRDATPFVGNLSQVLGRIELVNTWDKFLDNLIGLQDVGGPLSALEVNELAEAAARKVNFNTPAKAKGVTFKEDEEEPLYVDVGGNWEIVGRVGQDEPLEDQFVQVRENSVRLAFNLDLLKSGFLHVGSRVSKLSEEGQAQLDELFNRVQDLHVRLGRPRGLTFGGGIGSSWEGLEVIKTRMEDGLENVMDLVRVATSKAEDALGRVATQSNRDPALIALQEEVKRLVIGDREVRKRLLDLENAHRGLTNDLASHDTHLKAHQGLLDAGLSSGDGKLIVDFFSKPVVTSDQGFRLGLGDVLLRTVSGAPGGQAGMGGIGRGDYNTLQKSIVDLNERLASKCVTLDQVVFPTLTQTIKWCEAGNVPTDLDQALSMFTDAVSLAQSITSEFITSQETMDLEYKSARANMQGNTLHIHASFLTVLPDIFCGGGKEIRSNLPAAKKFEDWQDFSAGTHVGVLPRYHEGIVAQNANFTMTIAMMRDAYPLAASVATTMLAASLKFNDAIINMVSEMMGESRMRTDVSENEAWTHCSAIIRRVFHQLHQVRAQGSQAKHHQGSRRIGMTLWHMFQTHRLMQEFMTDGLRHHPSILSVTTSHLDMNRVSLSTYATMVAQMKVTKTKVDAMEIKVTRMEGRQGNQANRNRPADVP